MTSEKSYIFFGGGGGLIIFPQYFLFPLAEFSLLARSDIWQPPRYPDRPFAEPEMFQLYHINGNLTEKNKKDLTARKTQTPHSINQVHFGKQSLWPVEQRRHRRREQSCVFPDTAKGLPAETRRNIQRFKKFDTTLTELIITLQSCNNRAVDGWPLMSDGNLAPECKRWKQSVDFFFFLSSRFLFLNLGSLKPLNARFWNVTHIRVESFQLVADVLIRERRPSAFQKEWVFFFFAFLMRIYIVREQKRCNLCGSGLRWMRVTLSLDTARNRATAFVLYVFVRVSSQVPQSLWDTQTLTHYRPACLFRFCSDAAWL